MRFGFSGPRLFGIRPWLGFSPSELGLTKPTIGAGGNGHKEAAARTAASSFLYVIRGDHNMVKIGVTTNPTARIASLRTGSPFPLSYSFIGCTPGTGYDIEQEAHAYLTPHRCEGEWFDVSPEAAAAAILGAAAKLGYPIAVGTEENATLALKLSAGATMIPQWGFGNFAKALFLTILYYVIFLAFLVALPIGIDGYSLLGIMLAALFCAILSAKPKSIA